ncbi:SOR/SNZ family-domain-containing protein [Kickxella alabastrina]|uniref:SOR/SNZ family-domain-containing protein n=1 Tax=Kickxella alabastrina TaxID=61397 RepID=UPI00221F98B2|nr:SOR/SNZ family-domain-containing protein [Kickxella alabastrina]KAI7834160.1 SOR/SNZ family-domain-containing protein [Kickxella alabastrina]
MSQASAVNKNPLNTIEIKRTLMKLFVGGVIFEVSNVEQARIAERSGGRGIVLKQEDNDGVNRMADTGKIKELVDAVSLPIIGRVRIGHTVEASLMERAGANIIDESEALAFREGATPIDKNKQETPFICGASTLDELFKAINSGAAMIRIVGDSENEDNDNALNLIQTLKNILENKKMLIKHLQAKVNIEAMPILPEVPDDNGDVEESERTTKLIEINEAIEGIISNSAPVMENIKKFAALDKLPVPIFTTVTHPSPADAAMLMQNGFDGITVSESIFTGHANPLRYANSIIKVVANPKNLNILAEVTESIGMYAFNN